MAKILNNEAIEAVACNNQLMADVANALDVSLLSMSMILQRKSRRLTEFPVLKLIADFLHCEMDALLIDDAKVEAE